MSNCHLLNARLRRHELLTDVASPETLLRLVQSVPCPKAQPIKLWLAKVGYERLQMADPALWLARTRESWQALGAAKSGSAAHDRAGDSQQSDRLLGRTMRSSGARSLPSSPTSFSRNGPASLSRRIKTSRA